MSQAAEDFFKPGTQARASACCVSCTNAAAPGADFCGACDARIRARMEAEAAALGCTFAQLCEAYALPDADPELRARLDARHAADLAALDADGAFIAGEVAALEVGS